MTFGQLEERSLLHIQSLKLPTRIISFGLHFLKVSNQLIPLSVFKTNNRFELEWGDKRRLPDLKEFLEDALFRRSKRGQLWAAMAEFTPKPLDIVLRPTSGLRNMAQVVNIPITYWFQDKSWYPKTNIVATDFFLGNNLVQSSIIANLKGINCTA